MKKIRNIMLFAIISISLTTLFISPIVADGYTDAIIVKDIHTGSTGSSPYNLTDVEGTLYFSADSGTTDCALWKSDGTEAGTVMVKDINPSVISNIYSLADVGGMLYFSADDGVIGMELWKSDGTAEGTVMVKDICPGSTGSSPYYFADVGGTLYFQANDGTNGAELWKSDGTDAGTVMVKDIRPGSTGSSPYYLKDVGGTLYFQANDGTNGAELWKSDGTAAGTVIVKNIYSSTGHSNPSQLTDINGTIYFRANDYDHGYELWKSDGTDAGTVMVKDINLGYADSTPSYLINVDGTLYFIADDGTNGFALWKSDGTDAGTVMVKDINPSGISYFYSFADVGGMLYFSADDMVNGVELWKSDGTAAGTVMVKDICPGSTGSSSLKLTDVGGTLYFSANDGTNGFELWKSDGTEAGTVMVKDINPSDASSSPNYLINIDGTLYFQANDGVYGAELWKIASILLVPTTLDLTAADYQIASDGFSETDVTVYIEDQGGSPLDGITVYFNTNNGTLNSVSETTEGGYASVTLTSDFSEDEIIIATVTATADGLSDATAVFFVPSGQMVNDIETEIVNGSGTLEGTLTGGNIAIDADGEHIVTVAEYQGNPQDDTVFKVAGNFVDVHLNDADGVNWVTIQFCPANPNTKIFYWDGSGWPEASNYTYDETSGCVIVTITSTTQPSLSDLAGLIFVPGETVVEVEIDIKPGSDPNSINLRSKGVVPVAILTTDTFDAADVDPVTVTFAGASPLRWAMEDIDSDGDTDIVFYFKTQELALDSESVEAILEGSTFSGPDIEGVDSVKIPAGSK